jgi:ADP-ribose pyrophosphatase YjhB (NUDIX family)
MSRRFELARMLESFDPPPWGIAARNEMILLTRSSFDVFSRYVYDPGHFTASGFVLSPDLGSVLLVHHRRLDRWLQPGGHVDPTGERMVDAARREIAEETGVNRLGLAGDGIFDVHVHEVPAARGEPRHRHYDVRFLFRSDEWDLTAAAEVRDVAWVPLGDVAEVTSDLSVRLPLRELASRREGTAR